MTLLVIRTLQRQLPGVFGEMDRLWTETVLTWSKCYPGIDVRGLRKIAK